jgi:hypothetical protein
MSQKTKDKILKTKTEKLTKVVVIDVETMKELEILTTTEAILKYELNRVRFYYVLKNGGMHKKYYWRYLEGELIKTKTKQENYVKPERNKGYKIVDNNKIYTLKKVYYKHKIDDVEEIEFKMGTKEAAVFFNLSQETIKRKCRINNTLENIFRYENNNYKFNIKKGVKRKVKSIDKNGYEKEFDSLTEAAESLVNGKITSILSVCKGRSKTYKGLKFEYIN